MSGEVIRLRDWKKSEWDTHEPIPTSHARSSRAFISRVDLNLINIDAVWYDYIVRLAEGVYKSVWAGANTCTNVDYILRVEYQIQACSVFECKKLLEILDSYLLTPTISTSPERHFITHARNKVFERLEELKSS